MDDSYLRVRARAFDADDPRTEGDRDFQTCSALRRLLRDRPCLPPDPANGQASFADVASGIHFPLYTCPFKNFYFHTEYRELFLHHVAGGAEDRTHLQAINAVCKVLTPGRSRLCYIAEAVAIAERENFPKVGLSVTRRVLRHLCHRYCDAKIQAGACFVCAQLRTTVEGYRGVDLESGLGVDAVQLRPRVELEWLSAKDLRVIEANNRGTL